MIKFEYTDVYGFDAAIRGMRTLVRGTIPTYL